jgi:hypothetical protein
MSAVEGKAEGTIVYVPETAVPRRVPSGFDEEARAAFLAVAERAAVEEVNAYTVIGLGVGAYLSSLRFPRDSETPESWVR